MFLFCLWFNNIQPGGCFVSYNENYTSQVKTIKIDMQRTKIKTAKSPGIPTPYIQQC